MSNMQERLELRLESKKRVRSINFGDPVTNICAGEDNPQRHSYFVAYELKSHKNGFGITHHDHYAKCTNREGKFWNVDIDVIYPGHLCSEKCSELFQPVWNAQFA